MLSGLTPRLGTSRQTVRVVEALLVAVARRDLAVRRPWPIQYSGFRAPWIERRCFSGERSGTHIVDKDNDGAQQSSLLSTAPQDEVKAQPIPWYLEVAAPKREESPISERQRIPDLPEHPPDMLEPLLRQISIDLGLDDLTVLDLRNLDPPPALGANLLMIVGTARSEKHLHVSADRLCRWLRSAYKLRPDADGLLGRNELKLKLKRKARRAKLVGSNLYDEDTDDGVRTGWICVNVGIVTRSEEQQVSRPMKGSITGFGTHTDGVRIVVQMMVEDKRQEMDLEKLWTGISRRQTQTTEGDGVQDSDAAGPGSAEQPNSLVTAHPQQATTVTAHGSQLRGYHTSTRNRMQQTSIHGATADSSQSMLQHLWQRENETPDSLPTDLQQLVASALRNGKYVTARRMIIEYYERHLELDEETWRIAFLQSLLTHLDVLSPDEAIQALGFGPDDRSSTPLVFNFYQTISPNPRLPEWEALVNLHCSARALGASQYSAGALASVVREAQSSGISVPARVFIRALTSILSAPRSFESSIPSDIRAEDQTESLKTATDLIYDMHNRGLDVLSPEVFLCLLQATANYPSSEIDVRTGDSPPTTATNSTASYRIPFITPSDLTARITTLLFLHMSDNLNKESQTPHLLDPSNLSAQLLFMQFFASIHDWPSFFLFFRAFAAHGRPRNAALYVAIFNHIADTRHQRGVMCATREWISDMDREEPAVRLAEHAELREAIMRCVRVAEPEIDLILTDDTRNLGEWVRLWRRCEGK